MISIIDGGYLSWVYGTSDERQAMWAQNRMLYSRRMGSVVFLDGDRNERINYDPTYKSRRADLRAIDPEWVIRTTNVRHFRDTQLKHDKEIHWVQVDGLEADDIIAIFAQLTKKDFIVKGVDKDLLQIPSLHLGKSGMESLDGEAKTLETFQSRVQRGVYDCIDAPIRILLYLALNGDKSDSVPRLVPPRRIDILRYILTHPTPFQEAYEWFGQDFINNLYLTVLPGPWVFDPVPTPWMVYFLLSNSIYPSSMLRIREDVLEALAFLL